MTEYKNPIVTVHMASGGEFTFELWPDKAPNASSCIVYLAQSSVYNGQTIDRIVPGFVVQPRYSDEGRPDLDFMIKGEFKDNGFDKGADFEIGVIGMAGDGEHISSGSSFFITLGGCERLNGKFTAVGRIISGWDEIKRLENVPIVPVDSGMPRVTINCPEKPEIMEKVTVETFGREYHLPVKIKEQ